MILAREPERESAAKLPQGRTFIDYNAGTVGPTIQGGSRDGIVRSTPRDGEKS